ncbi:uncharacterized protein [Ptychodera flava]|uniref:uncharacterized protein isoform X2 n=1 Tax=Ptychodera flava TaxID=63121 RepID=UPI00396A1DB4
MADQPSSSGTGKDSGRSMESDRPEDNETEKQRMQRQRSEEQQEVEGMTSTTSEEGESDAEQSQGQTVLESTDGQKRKTPAKKKQLEDLPMARLWARKGKRQRTPYELEVKVRIDGIIPIHGNSVSSVDTKFYASARTKENAIEVKRQLNGRYKDMKVKEVSIEKKVSFVMDCQSLEDLQALMNDYSSGSLNKMAITTLQYEGQLDEIGALYLSLQTSIDYEEYVICQEELEIRDDMCILEPGWETLPKEERKELAKLRALPVEEISEINEGVMSEIKREKSQNDVLSYMTRLKLTDRDILRGMIDTERNERETASLFAVFLDVMRQVQGLKDNAQDSQSMAERHRAYIDYMVDSADIREEMKELYRRMMVIEKGIPLRGTIRTLTHPGSEPGQVNEPCGLIIKPNGEIVVASSGNVQTLTGTNQCVSRIAFHGFPVQFLPQDVAMSGRGTYYIAVHKSILVCNEKSHVQRVMGKRVLRNPTGISVSTNGIAFVADNAADRVFKYGRYSESIAQSQPLMKPWSVALNSRQQLIVSCQGEDCIRVLDSDLNIESSFGHGHVQCPFGVCVDQEDNVYVCVRSRSETNGKIVKFSSSFEYMYTVSEGIYPHYVAVFPDGRIVYTDNRDNCIRIIYS